MRLTFKSRMSHHKNSKEKTKSSDGKNKDTKSNFFQDCKLGEANAEASPKPRLEEEDSVSSAVLSKLKMFRRENIDLPGTICRENGGMSDPCREPA